MKVTASRVEAESQSETPSSILPTSTPGANQTSAEKVQVTTRELQLNNSELRSDEMMSGYVGKTQKNEHYCPISRYIVLVNKPPLQGSSSMSFRVCRPATSRENGRYLSRRIHWATPAQPEAVSARESAPEAVPARGSAPEATEEVGTESPLPTHEVGTEPPPHPHRRRKRRRRASSAPQGPETTLEVVLWFPKRLALPAPTKRLALPPLLPPSKPSVLPLPPRLSALLPLPRPSEPLEPAWSVPPSPPWQSARTPDLLEPAWSVPPAPP
ncbi:hypothetical protein DPX16_3912 [Anabarilius grahami]|uniref:Uncharacterized protein n=1 Tax=Anabarilius grahami TaxID=495550 RepID=A0A3N0XL88_ANAGA|nr:hypothetical protein DPX16_3912 [Anabarilius grahami]